MVGVFLNMCAMWVSAGVDGKGELWGEHGRGTGKPSVRTPERPSVS